MTRVLRPEWAALFAAAISWVWMLGEAVVGHRCACCAANPTLREDSTMWLAMVSAMMLPTIVGQVRDVVFRSYRARRWRAALAYSSGYAAVWALAGGPLLALRRLAVVRDPRVATAVALFAILWMVLPIRERWHRLCHRSIVLRPTGLAADGDAFRQGALNGIPCVAMCFPLMVACTATGHDLVFMLGATVLGIVEKRMYKLQRRPLVIGASLLAAWTLTLWLPANAVADRSFERHGSTLLVARGTRFER